MPLILLFSRRDKSRRILEITEVTGMEGNTITMQEIFKYRQEGYDENNMSVGDFYSTGIRPKCCEKITASGVQVDDHWFF